MTWVTNLTENLRDHRRTQPGQPRLSLPRIPALRVWDPARSRFLPEVWSGQWSLESGSEPLPAAPGTQDVLDGATVTPGRHLPPTDSSCAVCLPGTSRTQPTLGDQQGREGKKVCVRVTCLFCFVVGFYLLPVWPCCVRLIALTLLARMVALRYFLCCRQLTPELVENSISRLTLQGWTYRIWKMFSWPGFPNPNFETFNQIQSLCCS